MKRQIPNLITLCNLLCGVVASYVAIADKECGIKFAAAFICLGILFDFFDGLAARLLNVPSEIGKELDSLADVVTSGVAPAMILFQIILAHAPIKEFAIVAFLIPLFAAYRLAKFNLDTRQRHSFLGLPVPSNALIWVGVALSGSFVPSTIPMLTAFILVTLAGDVLMISELPMFSLKFNFKKLSWKDNSTQYIFLIGCVLIALLLRDWIAISIIILWYIVLSVITCRQNAN
ncbi:MAG: CDP-diacylglycerol--serine O-phosphatidyltransferase [Bacteroidales bacterium]|nr:CDP-diacylglycerol--serine O-phosphatidyltransferase [Bacteroidales bacterium]